MYCHTLLVILTLAVITQNALAFNVLAIISLPLKSHYMAFQSLFRELAHRGHSVTVMNNFPLDNPLPNMTFVDLGQQKNAVAQMPPLEMYETFPSTFSHVFSLYRYFSYGNKATNEDCENFFTNEAIKAQFAKGIKYDVIFVEQFVSDCALAYASIMSDAPIIGITAHVLLPYSYPRLGIPFDHITQPFYFSKAGPNPSIYHKIEALILDTAFKIAQLYVQRNIYDIFNRHLPDNTLDVEKVARERMKMMFVYQHFSLFGARPASPQILEIGGMHVNKPKPVPEELEKFLSTAEHGAIYVSFGSNLKASTMSKKKMQEFLKAFKKIPQKVIWKYEGSDFPSGHENVYNHKWFSQLDVLCHPKVIAFVTHGGMLSVTEAVHCGKPVLSVPFFGDQFNNAAAARSAGMGSMLFFDQLNADNLANGIQEITSDEIQQNAKRISKLWHDRPLSVMDSAIYWTEYVARHGQAPPSLPSKYTTWFESVLLHGVTVSLIFLLIIYTIFKLIKLILRKTLGRLLCKQKQKRKSKKE